MATTRLSILKMECSSCAILIEEISEETPGITKAEVDARKRTLTVEHETAEHVEQLRTALAEQGFPVEQFSEDDNES